MLRKLEKYELLNEIGHGGMATVYRARDERLERLVAVKVLHPHLQKAPEARVRFTREAKSVARLKHPNILEIYDYSGEDSPESYIAAELLTGPTLKRFIDEDRPELPGEIAACFTIQIARALECAHADGIIHRDVKPENVLLHENRCVKLTDFGIAQMVDAQSFTATGQILGSPGHMAPEQVEGIDIDERSDIFSLGTVLYFLAVGRLPFVGKNPHHVLKRIMDADFPDPLRVRPSIGSELAGIIRKAMARSPDDRFSSVNEMADALNTFLWRSGVEDPDELLIRYLHAPDETTLELTELVVANLTTLGREAASQGDRAGALDAFNRVLALDEGNEEVLRQIERLGKGDRTPLFLSVALGAMVLATAAFAFWPSGEPDPIERDPVLTTRVDAGASTDTADTGPTKVALVADGDAAQAEAQPDAASEPTESAPSSMDETMRPVVVRGTRVVSLVPDPLNAQIAIDDEPLRLYDSSFNQLELRVGPHRVRVVPNASPPCCEELVRTVQVRPGQGVQREVLRLRVRPAYLSIESAVPADLTVQGLAGRRRTSQAFPVPLQEPSETRRFTVTAPGYAEYTGTVELRGGDETVVRVNLVPAPEAP